MLIKKGVWALQIEVKAGIMATQLVESFGRLKPISTLRTLILGLDPAKRAKSVWIGDMDSLIPSYLTVLVDGCLLSLGILAVAIVLYLLRRAWLCILPNS